VADESPPGTIPDDFNPLRTADRDHDRITISTARSPSSPGRDVAWARSTPGLLAAQRSSDRGSNDLAGSVTGDWRSNRRALPPPTAASPLNCLPSTIIGTPTAARDADRTHPLRGSTRQSFRSCSYHDAGRPVRYTAAAKVSGIDRDASAQRANLASAPWSGRQRPPAGKPRLLAPKAP